MSCRRMKDEMYGEMRKEVDKVQHHMNASWPFTDLPAPRVQFPSRLFSSQEAIIEAPYLPVAKILSPRYYELIHEVMDLHQIFPLLQTR